MGYVFSRKWLGLQPRVNHLVDWCRSEDRPYFYDCVEKSSGQKLWLNLFLLDLVRFFSLIQTSIPIVPWKICVNIAFFSWSSFLLWNILEPFLWPEHTGTGKKIHLQKDCQHIVGKKNRKISMLQKLHEKNGSISEKEEWRRLEGKNPTKWHWEKGSWRWGLAKIEALQNGSGIFICFIKSWMHWFDHFLTKLSKYLWIKTGDRHYHFVEPWVIDRPFCRMETLYQSHFVETGVGSLQNGAPQPHPGNGKEDVNPS